MTRPLFVMICALAALTAACDGERTIRISSTHTGQDGPHGVLKVVDALQCPQTMGSLTRKGTAHAGGSVCTYVGAKGAEVSLHLIQLDGTSVDSVLEAFQTRLSQEMPLTIARLRAAEETAAAEAARADGDAAQADAEAARADAAAAEESTTVQMPGVHIETHGDNADVKLPGINIQSHGDRSHVRIGGINIQSSDGSGQVNIQSGEDRVSIQSHADSTEVRTSTGGDATRITWVLNDPEASESGWRLVGYEARGPRGGPIVVATVRSRDSERGRVFADARDLVTLNVGR
ncbi:methyltransferase type 11 [Brevundimonas sp.]|uniref:methyltransferase type 11 n=1 Tax=Brevundimonas sp. TaxID=1871086 RepID=UPI003A8D7FA5